MEAVSQRLSTLAITADNLSTTMLRNSAERMRDFGHPDLVLERHLEGLSILEGIIAGVGPSSTP